MSRLNYDDWNIAGNYSERTLPGSVPYSSRTNSTIFISSACLLLIFGLISLYSASFPIALANGLDSYAYFMKQLLYTCTGVVLAIFIYIIPEKALKVISPVFMILCLSVLGINYFVKSNFLISEEMLNLVFLAHILYLSLFFSNRLNGVNRLRELVLPIVFSILFLVTILIQKNFASGLLFFLLTVVMFACGGVGFGGVMLFVLYALVPAVCWIIADETNLKTILNLLMPGYFNSGTASQYIFAKSAIAGGGLFGKGLGMGEFKSGLIQDITGEFIFCNVCEEFGFIGALILLVLLLVFAWTGFRCAKHLRNENRFYSNISIGITTIIVWQAILNLLSVFSVIPISGFSLPFFSEGVNIILLICECALLYKACRVNAVSEQKPDITVNNRKTESFYDLENS